MKETRAGATFSKTSKSRPIRELTSCSSCHTLHVRDAAAGVLAWQENCIACHRGNAGYDELHAYDREAMDRGTVP